MAKFKIVDSHNNYVFKEKIFKTEAEAYEFLRHNIDNSRYAFTKKDSDNELNKYGIIRR